MLFAVDFAVDRVAGATRSRHASGSFAAVGATTLGHETVDHAMESESVIKPIFCQLDEVGHGVRGIVVEHLQLDLAGVRGHENRGQSFNTKTPC